MEDKLFSKVFLWLFVGLLITFLTGFYVSLNSNMLLNIVSNGTYIFIFIAEFLIAIFLGVRIGKMHFATALFSYLFYTFLTGLTFAVLFAVFELGSIIYAFGITSLIVLVMGLIGYFTEIDLSKFRNIFLFGLVFIIIANLINMFLGNTIADFGLVIFGIVLFLGFVAYDIQKIKNRLMMIESDKLAIYGAFILFLDFINLFIRILRLVGRRRD